MDDDLKRLKRFIVISWVLLLIIILGLVFWGSYQIKNLKQVIANQPKVQTVQSIPGKDGSNGEDGLSVIGPVGLTGTPGTPGVTGPQGLQGPQGVQGPQGDPGPAGKAVYVRQNPLTGDLECKFGDLTTIWLPLSECQ